MRTLKINGSVYTGILLDNWSIAQKNNSVSTFKIGVLDIDSSQNKVNIANILEGSSIEFLDNSNKLFSGIIKTITKSDYSAGILKLDFTCNDNSEIANRRIVARSIVFKTAGWIVENVILPILAEEGVEAGNIEEGVQLVKVNFNYISCKKALDYLQTCTGFNWNIDINKKLNFSSISQVVSPFEINDDTVISNFKSTRKYEQYRNVQYILGGQAITSPQINEELTPAPDGETRTFNTRFALYQKPSLEIYSNGSWSSVADTDIGIKNIDSGKKFYFEFSSRVIEQDSSQTVLAAGQKIRATYIGLKNVFLAYENDYEINNRSLIESSSGKYEMFEKNSSLDSNEAAQEYAASLLQKYGEIEDRISFDIEQPGLEAGQLLNASNLRLGIEGQFLIESVTVKPLGNSVQYSVSALDGISLGGWENYFKALVAKNEESIAANENVIFIKKISDISDVNSQTDITIRRGFWKHFGNSLWRFGTTTAGDVQRIEVSLNE